MCGGDDQDDDDEKESVSSGRVDRVLLSGEPVAPFVQLMLLQVSRQS